MKERQIRDRLKWMGIVILAVVVILIAIVCSMGVYLHRTLVSETNIQMKTETGEFAERLDKQIRNDFQLLNTVSSMIEMGSMESMEEFPAVLYSLNQENDFVSIMYFNTERVGISASTKEYVHEVRSYEDIHEECGHVLEEAFQGRMTLSKDFDCPLSGMKEFAYGVPVYRDGEIIGALAGIKTEQNYRDVLDIRGVMSGKGYVHLLDSEGRFIVFSDHSVLNRELRTIYEGVYFDQREHGEVKELLKRGEMKEFEFTYSKINYRGLLDPVGYNGWYLLCVSTYQNEGNALYRIVVLILTAFFLILMVLIIFFAYVTKVFGKGYQNLIDVTYYDSLSTLYSKYGFLQKVEEIEKAIPRFTLVGINLYQFKYLNEVFGKKKADSLLTYIGEKVKDSLSENEFACRNTADVFYLFLCETDKGRIEGRLNVLLDKIESSAGRFGSSYQLRTYCGCVIVDRTAEEIETSRVFTHLVFTMSQAKHTADRRICFYDGQLFEKMQVENYVEGHMKKALEEGEFQMYLQPKVDLSDGRICGAEALVRWMPHDGGIIYPDQFIPVFERNGFCVQLDMYMIDCACRQIRSWMNQGIEPIGISVNQTRLLFRNPDYAKKLEAVVRKYGVPPELITLEILEGTFTDNPSELADKIVELKSCGFRVSMDDFGSGYSSLNILSKLKIDELKIDREFLRELTADGEGRAEVVLEQVVHMTKKLNISTVVEGVETDEQEDLVKNLDIDFGQGYYYSRPIHRDDFHDRYMADPAV